MKENIKMPRKIGKKGIIAIVVAVVLAIAVLATSLYVSNNKVKVYSDVIYMLMEKEKAAEDGSGRVFHIRKNAEFNSKDKNASILDAFEIYYNDENGNEIVYKTDDMVLSDDQEIGADLVILTFTTSAIKKFNTVKSIAVIVAIVIAVLVVIGLIFLWYKIWSKKEDEEKARRLAKINQKKK